MSLTRDAESATAQMDGLARARQAQAAGGSVKNAEKLKSGVLNRLTTAERPAVEDRLSQIPKTCIKTYLTAMRGRSLAAAVKANCQYCMGWEDYRTGIRNCTDPACPLFCYRPYQR